MLLNANSTIFSAISWREQVNFQSDDDEVRFVLDQHAELDSYSASSLKQQSAGRHVAQLFLLNDAYLAEKQGIPTRTGKCLRQVLLIRGYL